MILSSWDKSPSTFPFVFGLFQKYEKVEFIYLWNYTIKHLEAKKTPGNCVQKKSFESFNFLNLPPGQVESMMTLRPAAGADPRTFKMHVPNEHGDLPGMSGVGIVEAGLVHCMK